jgi:hypothetical protein
MEEDDGLDPLWSNPAPTPHPHLSGAGLRAQVEDLDGWTGGGAGRGRGGRGGRVPPAGRGPPGGRGVPGGRGQRACTGQAVADGAGHGVVGDLDGGAALPPFRAPRKQPTKKELEVSLEED